jgi:hypothetical protein
MGNRVNTAEIDERLIVARVRGSQVKQEIVAPPLVPLPATVSESVSANAPEPVPAQPVTVADAEIPASPPEPQKEETRSKRAGLQEYETLFIKETDLPPARFGKSVYIRREYHDRISQIISVIGGNEVSLFGYIDNVLAHHMENYRDEIIRSFKKKTIFK